MGCFFIFSPWGEYQANAGTPPKGRINSTKLTPVPPPWGENYLYSGWDIVPAEWVCVFGYNMCVLND